MRTILAALLMLVGGSAYAVSFDPATGTGSVTENEVRNLYGWNAVQYRARGVGFTYVRADRYTVVVQFVNGNGATVTQSQTVDVQYTTTVRNTMTGSGLDLTGYGVPNRLGRIPQVGDRHLAADGGSFVPGGGGLLPVINGIPRPGVITNVTAPSSSGKLLIVSSQYGTYQIQ